MAELADALVLGTSGQPCRFKSCYPHQKRERLSVNLEFMEGLFYYGHLCNIQDRNATDHEQYVCSILTIEIFSGIKLSSTLDQNNRLINDPTVSPLHSLPQ